MVWVERVVIPNTVQLLQLVQHRSRHNRCGNRCCQGGGTGGGCSLRWNGRLSPLDVLLRVLHLQQVFIIHGHEVVDERVNEDRAKAS